MTVTNTGKITPGIYRHYKGKEYEVLGEATHSETGEVLVVYRALYGQYRLWVRPKTMFEEYLDIGDTKVARFSCVIAF